MNSFAALAKRATAIERETVRRKKKESQQRLTMITNVVHAAVRLSRCFLVQLVLWTYHWFGGVQSLF